MKAPAPPQMNLTVRRNGKKGWVLSSYDSVWIPEKVGEDGKIIKGHARQKNLHVVAHIAGGKRDGWVAWRDPEFVRNHPELEFYEMYRKGSKNYFFLKSLLEGKDGISVDSVDVDGERVPAPSRMMDDLSSEEATCETGVSGNGDTYPDGTRSMTGKSILSASARMGQNPANQGMDTPDKFGMSACLTTSKRGNPLVVKNASAHAVFASASRTGLADAIYKVLGKRHGSHILTAVANTVLTGSLNLQGIDNFVNQFDVPIVGGITSTACINSLKKVDHDKVQKILSKFAGATLVSSSAVMNIQTESGEKLVIQVNLDGSMIKNENDSLLYVVLGKHKDGGYGEQIVFQLLTTTGEDGLPITYVLGNGNCNDISMVERTINEFGIEGIHNLDVKLLYVADRAYGTAKVVDMLLRSGQSFLLNWNTSSTYGREAALEALKSTRESSAITTPSSWIHFDEENKLIGYKLVVMEHRYDSVAVTNKRKVKDSKTNLYCHVFYDREICIERERSLLNLASTGITGLKAGRELTDRERIALTSITNFDPNTHTPKSDAVSNLKIDDAKLAEAVLLFGLQVLVTNEAGMSAADAYRCYQNRTPVETANQRLKGNLKSGRLGAKTDGGVVYRSFVAFCSAVIECDLANHLKKEAKKFGGSVPEHMRSIPGLLRECRNLNVYVYDNEMYKGKIYSECTGKTQAAFAVAGLNLSDFVSTIKSAPKYKF